MKQPLDFVRKITSLEELFEALNAGLLVGNENWGDNEFIVVSDKLSVVIDEKGAQVNAIALLENWNQGDFYVVEE
jgi:hypothetical protein